MNFLRWLDSWITTLIAYPPFSKRKAELIQALRDGPDSWVDAPRPGGDRRRDE